MHCRPPRRTLVLLAVALSGGCAPLGALLYKLTPESEIPARYVLKDVPTVVLVENFRSPDLAANDAELLGRTLQKNLEEKKVVAKLIRTEKILDLRNNRPKDFPTMTVPQIAKAVGAEQVIYVDLQAGGISSLTGQSMFQGKAAAAVKVVDAESGASLWPPDSTEGFGVNAETNTLKGREEGSYAAVRSDLYENLAKKIGRLFYKWKQSEDDASNEPNNGRG